jgi:hypothetical protein
MVSAVVKVAVVSPHVDAAYCASVGKAIRAYMAGDTEWFPLGVDLPDIGERLCTYLPWFGESKSIFVYEYLRGLLRDSGFIAVTPALECGQSLCAPTEWEAGSLDDRCRMSLIVEALK